MNPDNSFLSIEIDQNPPIPANEMKRLTALGDLDLDYLDLNKSFADLTKNPPIQSEG